MKFNEPKQSLSDSQKGKVIMDNDIRRSDYYYDEFQRHKARSYGVVPDREYKTYDPEKSDNYEYNDKDWLEKSKYKTTLKQYYPVYNQNLLVKLNQIEVPKKADAFGEDGKIWPNYNEHIYIYIYDNQGRIIEEKEYDVYRSGKETLHKKHKKEDLVTRKLFVYNDKGQVINQKIIAGLRGEKIGAYTDMGTECGFCEDLQLQYEYDQLGRISQVIMYGCGKIVDKEEYTYHPTKDYVETVKYYVTGPGEMSNPTQNFVETFNEQGDIIKKEFIPNNPKQKLEIKEYYYSYEYDSHNNWIKCNIYMEGTKEGEPSLVAERKIEYYN
ncbi:hypothetical protein [Flavobacterium sp.]|uniref:hypothetical protein n=1 Tax=Flavobacterium sp. TaxID=239 RepID=UPI002B6C2456|nr:hypothetical protein [Flavobacterium sp.]HSD06443.1 hypothetical protein [Flavobacterium sp.]